MANEYYGYSQAPVGRPPPPPPGFPTPSGRPPPMVAGAGDLTCYPHDANTRLFLDLVRQLMVDEWVRLRGLSMDQAETNRLTSELMAAFNTGKVIPGFYQDAQGNCFMHWNELACFARWYARLYGPERLDALDSLAAGSRAPWAEVGEYVWPPPPTLCGPNSSTEEAEYCAENPNPEGTCPQYCCPEDVWNDPTFDPRDGKWAKALRGDTGDEGGTPGWLKGLIVVGAAAVSLGLVAMVVGKD